MCLEGDKDRYEFWESKWKFYMAGHTAYDLGFERDDVDWDDVSRFPDTYQADNMRARYAFGITD